jgi:hypothetical protein
MFEMLLQNKLKAGSPGKILGRTTDESNVQLAGTDTATSTRDAVPQAFCHQQ